MMKPTSAVWLVVLAIPLSFAACRPSASAPPGYAPLGQWTAPEPPPEPAAPAPSANPFPWWPQAVPAPAVLPIPGLGEVPGLPVAGPAQQCVDTINQYRARAYLPPLTRWIQNEPCAAGQARMDATSRRPHGSAGQCGELAQNVCPAWPGPAERTTAQCLHGMWKEGPGGDLRAHADYANMASSRFTRVACGYFATPDGLVWAVQDFQ